MEILNRKTSLEASLPPIQVSTNEFIELIEKLPEDGPVEVTIGDYLDRQQIKLQGIDDVRNNQPFLSVPLKLTKGGLEISIREKYVNLTAPVEKGHVFESTQKLLGHYRLWFYFVKSGWFFSIAVLGPMAVLTLFGNLKGYDLFSAQIFAATVLGAPLIFIDRKLLKSKIVYSPRSTFFQRNKDNLLMLVIRAVIGGIATKLFGLFGS